jgi:DNA-binding transcriptional LysR family regulator
MDPRHLMQLAVILEKGSITAAAQHLLLTQPTLTRNMATLEMQTGTPLFERSRYGARSTPLGENLARLGRSIARQMQAADEVVSRHRIGLNTELRVAAGPLIGMALMPRLSEALLRANTHMALTVTTGRPLSLIDQLIDGDFDVVIAPAVYAHIPQGISRQLLAHDAISIFCGPSHPLAQVSAPSAQTLGACDWMNVGTTSPFQNAEIEMLERSGIERVRTQFATVSDAVILLQVLMRGHHLAVLPRLPLRLLQDTYPLVELPPPQGHTQRDLYIWARSDLQADPNFQTFVHHACDLVA